MHCWFALLLLSWASGRSCAASIFRAVQAPQSQESNKFFDEVVIPTQKKVQLMDPAREKVVVTSANASSLRECASFNTRIQTADHKLLIIGRGPAGLSAAIYAARAELEPLVISADGGQLESTSMLDNFPGFEDGTDAVELVQKMEKQATRFGARFRTCKVKEVDLSCRPFRVTCDDGSLITTSALIVATGASAKWLGVPGEWSLLAKGVHSCATCDGYFYKDKHVAVIGGGDTAMEQALFLARLGKKVTIVHRRGSFRASKAMVTRVLNHPKIEIMWNTKVSRFNPDATGKKLASLSLQNVETSKTSQLQVAGSFTAIGHTPNTELFSQEGVKVNDAGYIVTVPGSTRTSVVGVYAAGDVQDSVYRQAITSAGTGAMAAIDAERWLCEHGC